MAELVSDGRRLEPEELTARNELLLKASTRIDKGMEPSGQVDLVLRIMTSLTRGEFQETILEREGNRIIISDDVPDTSM